MHTEVISARSISKQYNTVHALTNITLSASPGEIFGFLGPNGAGKTTMINILTGQTKATTGQAEVLGIDCKADPLRVRANVGIVPEQENPPSFLSATEYLHFVSKIRNINNYESKCTHWLDFLEFGTERNILSKDLSRGTRQKLMIAQAFLHEPKVVFIDEPLVNLDPIIQKKVKDYLKNYSKKGNTVFLSTHVLEIAEELCDRIAIIDKGKMIACGSLESLREKKDETLESIFIRLVRGHHAHKDS